MNYQESYGCDCVFDTFRGRKVFGQFIDLDWVKTQVYGQMFVIPETFPKKVPELYEILFKLNIIQNK